MKIKITKEHPTYNLGFHHVSEERGRYLIAMGVAEEVGIYEKEQVEIKKEKKEFVPTKEKVVKRTRTPNKK